MAKVKEELITTKLGDVEITGRLVITGTTKQQFVVHYGGNSRGDGREYGKSKEEQEALRILATTILLDLYNWSKK